MKKTAKRQAHVSDDNFGSMLLELVNMQQGLQKGQQSMNSSPPRNSQRQTSNTAASSRNWTTNDFFAQISGILEPEPKRKRRVPMQTAPQEQHSLCPEPVKKPGSNVSAPQQHVSKRTFLAPPGVQVAHELGSDPTALTAAHLPAGLNLNQESRICCYSYNDDSKLRLMSPVHLVNFHNVESDPGDPVSINAVIGCFPLPLQDGRSLSILDASSISNSI